jgi:hypothetical protein
MGCQPLSVPDARHIAAEDGGQMLNLVREASIEVLALRNKLGLAAAMALQEGL